MDTSSLRLAVPFDSSPRFRAGLSALGVCLGGLVAGLVGIVVMGVLVPSTVTETDAFQLLSGNQIQVGFAAFGATYLLTQDNITQYLRIRRPTLRDIGWMMIVLVGVIAGSYVVSTTLSAVGITDPFTDSGGSGDQVNLLARPMLWPVALVGLYAFAAPAEELVYRGIVQGVLREAFDQLGIIVGSALSFGLLHLLVGFLTPAVGISGSLYWGISTLVPGVVWAYAYERTENLLVTAIPHAMHWTVLSPVLRVLFH